jgi:hypothetical protein
MEKSLSYKEPLPNSTLAQHKSKAKEENELAAHAAKHKYL